MVFDKTRDLRDVLKRLGHFFAHESCGKCYPCQMGTQRQKEILIRIADGKTLEGDIQRLQDIGWTMTDASLCGLGQTAASAVLSAMKLWPGLFSEESDSLLSKKKEVRGKEVVVKPKAVKAKAKPKKTVAKKAKVQKEKSVKVTKSKVSKNKAKKTSVKKSTRKK